MDRLKRHKGRFITEKKFNKRISFIELMRKKREEKKLMLESGATEPNRIVEGRRIIDFEVMTRFLNCVKCKEILSLGDIVKEARFGLASVFHVQCRKCDLINFVPSSKHDGSGRSDGRTYDVNISAVQGSVNVGLDLQTVKKFLSIMNIPGGTSKAFRPDKELHGPETKEASEGKKRVELEEKIKQEAQPNKVPPKRKRRSKNRESTESTAENNDNDAIKIANTTQDCANECSYQEYRQDFNNAYVAFENSFNNIATTSKSNCNNVVASQNNDILQENVMTTIPYKKIITQLYNSNQTTSEQVQFTLPQSSTTNEIPSYCTTPT